jgi:FMN phosphatase YigB (HAD superfamily)
MEQSPSHRRFRHVFLDAEGTLYVPKHGRSRWEFWCNPSTKEALEFFELDSGVKEAIGKLRGMVQTICLVSRNTEPILTALMSRFGLSGLFDAILLNGNKGDKIVGYLSEHGFERSEAVMVGDMPLLDLYPVRKVGVEAILVDREYNRWAKAERIKGVSELPTWLRIAEMAEPAFRIPVRNSSLDEFAGDQKVDCSDKGMRVGAQLPG